MDTEDTEESVQFVFFLECIYNVYYVIIGKYCTWNHWSYELIIFQAISSKNILHFIFFFL